jgi:ABC-type Fe3+/spermidine/putrescine transport system ATPase subunit
VAELLALVGLEGYEQRYPDQLSGGEQQRIALLRAIAPHPDILLLDEPLSALDFQLRKRLRQEIKNVQRRLGITMLYITHDQEEALSISDRIAVMRNGHVEQIGTPVEIYQTPQTKYVAQFVGISNVLSGTISQVEQGRFLVQSRQHQFLIPAYQDYARHDDITFFFRPEDSYLSRQPKEENTIRGKIIEHEYLGAEILTSVESIDQQTYIVSSYIKNESFIAHEGQEVFINFPVNACKIIHREE